LIHMLPMNQQAPQKVSQFILAIKIREAAHSHWDCYNTSGIL
jgi:hypothetical protein